MTAATHQSLSDALKAVRVMLEADGYGMQLSLDVDRLIIDIEPTPEACADCLLPAGVLENIMRQHLQKAGVPDDGLTLELHHPGSHA